jgi:hypothetical protein
MSLHKRIVDFLYERRNRVLSGQVNCIPLPFKRFRQEFPGIEQGVYYLISGTGKAAKTQLTNYLFVYNTIMYMYYHPNKVQAKIFYYPLEETAEAVTLRFMAFLLNHLDNSIVISPTDLKSTNETNPVPEHILRMMECKEFNDIMSLYEKVVTFFDSKNATGIYKDFKNYAENNGTTIYKEIPIKDELGREVKRKVFDHYIANNPDEYVFILTDHVSLLSPEKSLDGRMMDLRQSIIKFSEYMIIARDRYHYIPVVVQQQSTETTNLEAFKSNKIRPTKAGLADAKNTGNDCSCMIGITNPYSFEKPDYLGYDITTLKDRFRVIEIVLNRNGRANGLCPLLFNGAINKFEELPLPNTPELSNLYNSFKKGAVSFFIKSIKSLFKNG